MGKDAPINDVNNGVINIHDRVKALNAELEPLLKKYRLVLVGEPFIHEGRIVAKVSVAEAPSEIVT
jgi:hypothetical protein